MEDRAHFGFRLKSKVPRARQHPEPAIAARGVHHQVAPPGDADECKEWRRLIGERVCIGGVKQGTLRYYGRTTFAQGLWCGVELDEPVGKNDGTVNGVIYFACRPGHGIFAPVGKVSALNDPGEFCSREFIRGSASDPSFMRPVHLPPGLPHKSESFPHDRRSFTEQHRVSSADASSSSSSSKRGRTQQELSSKSSSSCILAKYGYGAKNKSLCDKPDLLMTDQFVPKKAPSYQKSEMEERYEHYELYEQYEQFTTLRTPTNSGEVSPLSSDTSRLAASRQGAMPPSFFDYKIPEELLDAFQSQEYQDELENDDQMSGDFDESLGILTPSQMRDLTLCPDLRTSCSDIRALDFPSSESFDDINDLPEDEQVHDVSVKYLPESSAAKRVLEVAKNFTKKDVNSTEDMVSSTDKFLFSISQKNFDPSEHGKQDAASSSNNLSSIGVLPDKLSLGLEAYATTCTKEPSLIANAPSPDAAYAKLVSENEAGRNLSDSNKIALRNFDIESYDKEATTLKNYDIEMDYNDKTVTLRNYDMENYKKTATLKDYDLEKFDKKTSSLKNYDIENNYDKKTVTPKNYDEKSATLKNYDMDGSRDSLLQNEPENSNGSHHHPVTALREKQLTVSWEVDSSGSPCVERPESVYTVASSDTGFQEDGEMATSIDSTTEEGGNKRFSTASRDSGTEMDLGYKIAESNSTSGYSTGLSDSCCNDVSSGKEIQDSVGPCDSEDAFSFQENNSSLEGTSEGGTVETTLTAMCHDSTSDALCETMVEDATMTEIHDLLLASPEEGKNPKEDNKENKEEDIPIPEQQQPVKTQVDRMSTPSSAKSTPERRPPLNRTRNSQRTSGPGTTTQQDQRTTSSQKSATSKVCDDKMKQPQPKKNVMSKIKAMIEKTANGGKRSEGPQRTTPSTPKKSRWEAVTSKIAASLAEEKTKGPRTKREVRSRVDTNLTMARQQVALCRSPKQTDSRSLSPVSLSSSRRQPLAERNSAPNSVKDCRASTRSSKQEPKSPRPKACLTSRSASPVAASESSTASLSLASHHSRSKIATWKGSTSTVASSVPPAPVTVKRQSAAAPPPTKPPLQTTRSQRMVTKKSAVNGNHPRITLQVPGSASVRSLSPASRNRSRKIEQAPSRASPAGRGVVRPPAWLSKAELGAEIQRLGTLCEARTKELNRLKMETRHVTAGFDAFAALFRYTVEELHALSVPALSEDLSKTLRQLELAKQDIAYFERESEEMKSHHCQELNDLSNRLFEVYQSEVAELNAKHQEEINQLKSDHQKQMEILQSTYDGTSAESKARYDKRIASLEQEIVHQREELQQLHDREIRDLERRQAEGERLLREQVEQLQGRCAELEQRSAAMEEALRRDTDSKLQWVTSAKLDLEKEVESLKAVLEMKNKELHALRVNSLEAEKQLEELPLAREKIKMLQARAEDLEALMAEKTRTERQLESENQAMRDTFERESKVNRRLSMENEELLWRLRQAENSLLSSSFADGGGTTVPECPEAEEEESGGGALSPTKSPQTTLSRSVFFTFADEGGGPSSPRFKKITPAFAAGYKTSPARAKSHSEPPPPPSSSSTPRKVARQVAKAAKRQRQRSGGSSAENQNRQPSSAELHSMASSCDSATLEHQNRLLAEENLKRLPSSAEHSMTSSCDSAMLEHQNRLLEKHRGHIAHSLEVLRSADDLCKRWCSDDIPGDARLPNDSDQMSRSAELFADPKTYYHMTFDHVTPRESSDAEDKNSFGHSPSKDSTHSMSENDICAGVAAARRADDNKTDSDRWRTI